MNDDMELKVVQVPSHIGDQAHVVRTASVLDQHKQARWMTQARDRDENVWFYREPMTDERATPEVILPFERWQALGEPDCITVVIERGDQLNGAEEWSVLRADGEGVVDVWDTP